MNFISFNSSFNSRIENSKKKFHFLHFKSAEREHRRKEAELAQKLARNPYIYFVTPQFRDWFREQQLILIVLGINLVVVLIIYQLFYTSETQ